MQRLCLLQPVLLSCRPPGVQTTTPAAHNTQHAINGMSSASPNSITQHTGTLLRVHRMLIQLRPPWCCESVAAGPPCNASLARSNAHHLIYHHSSFCTHAWRDEQDLRIAVIVHLDTSTLQCCFHIPATRLGSKVIAHRHRGCDIAGHAELC